MSEDGGVILLMCQKDIPVMFAFPWLMLQVIFSMADEYVPDYVDKKALVER